MLAFYLTHSCLYRFEQNVIWLNKFGKQQEKKMPRIFLIYFWLMFGMTMSTSDIDSLDRLALIANDDYSNEKDYESFYYNSEIYKKLVDKTGDVNCELLQNNTGIELLKHFSNICSDISNECQEQCDKLDKFDFKLDNLKSNFFSNIRIKKSIQLNFERLEKIESGAFHKLVVAADIQLRLNINGICYSLLKNESRNCFKFLIF